jgi:hypothetical protein
MCHLHVSHCCGSPVFFLLALITTTIQNVPEIAGVYSHKGQQWFGLISCSSASAVTPSGLCQWLADFLKSVGLSPGGHQATCHIILCPWDVGYQFMTRAQRPVHTC